MVYFVVFIARGRAGRVDTMKGKLSLAWYQSVWVASVREQSESSHTGVLQVSLYQPLRLG